MAGKQVILTQEGLEKLEQELEELKSVKRKEIAEKIKVALSFGDLSENSEYDEAKTEQGKLYSKIAELRNIIENSEVIETKENTKHVTLGSRVKVKCLEDNEIEEYLVVGSQEANPMNGRISDDSPFGRSLIGSAVGQTITVVAPAAAISYEILSIQ